MRAALACELLYEKLPPEAELAGGVHLHQLGGLAAPPPSPSSAVDVMAAFRRARRARLDCGGEGEDGRLGELEAGLHTCGLVTPNDAGPLRGNSGTLPLLLTSACCRAVRRKDREETDPSVRSLTPLVLAAP